jgi:hypothetical protein
MIVGGCLFAPTNSFLTLLWEPPARSPRNGACPALTWEGDGNLGLFTRGRVPRASSSYLSSPLTVGRVRSGRLSLACGPAFLLPPTWSPRGLGFVQQTGN